MMMVLVILEILSRRLSLSSRATLGVGCLDLTWVAQPRLQLLATPIGKAFSTSSHVGWRYGRFSGNGNGAPAAPSSSGGGMDCLGWRHSHSSCSKYNNPKLLQNVLPLQALKRAHVGLAGLVSLDGLAYRKRRSRLSLKNHLSLRLNLCLRHYLIWQILAGHNPCKVVSLGTA